jgi:hypothetical protein
MTRVRYSITTVSDRFPVCFYSVKYIYGSKWTLRNKNANVYYSTSEKDRERERGGERERECVHKTYISDLRNIIRKTKTLNRLKGILHSCTCFTIQHPELQSYCFITRENNNIAFLYTITRENNNILRFCILLHALFAVIAKTSSYTRFIICNGM